MSNKEINYRVRELMEYTGESAEQIAIKMQARTKAPPTDNQEALNGYYALDKSFYRYMRPDIEAIEIDKAFDALKIATIHGTKNVLDLGCGTGYAAIYFLKQGINATLCDIEGEGLNFVRWRFHHKPDLQNLRAKYDIINLNELKELHKEGVKFDAIICFDVLEHILEPLDTVKMIADLIADNGLLFMTAEFSGPVGDAQHIAPKRYDYVVTTYLKDRGLKWLKGTHCPLIYLKDTGGKYGKSTKEK